MRTSGLDLLLVVCLVLSGLRLTVGLEAVIDLTLFDETGYLYAGTHLLSRGLMPPAWAPLYGVWYFALAQLQPDPVALYYLNYRVLGIATPVLVYLLLRAYRLSPLVALPVAWLFLISMANLPVWPKPGSFALCLAILFLIAARDWQAPTRSVLLVATGALLCSYVRPEYLLAYLLLCGCYLVLVARPALRQPLRVELIQLLLFVFVSFALVRVFSLAPLDRKNNRSFEAFAQHYAINWAGWNGRDLDPWTQFDLAIADSFGAVDSLGAAAQANPAAIARHIGTNLRQYPGAVNAAFLNHLPLAPEAVGRPAQGGILLSTSLALAAIGWGLVLHHRELGARIRRQWLPLTVCGLLAAPAFVSATVIYPRAHYLLLQGVLLALALGLVLGSSRGVGRRAGYACAACAMTFVVLTPTVGVAWREASAQSSAHPNRSTVEAIRALRLEGRTHVLEAEGGFHVYLGDSFQRVPHTARRGALDAFLREQGVDLIVVSEKLRRDRRYTDDPAWQALLADPAAAGFTAVAVPGTDRQLLVLDAE